MCISCTSPLAFPFVSPCPSDRAPGAGEEIVTNTLSLMLGLLFASDVNPVTVVLKERKMSLREGSRMAGGKTGCEHSR